MGRRLTAFAVGTVLLWMPHVSPAQDCCAGQQCAGDLDCNGQVDLSEVITAVNSSLYGCSVGASPTPTPSIPIASPTPTTTPGGQRLAATGQTTCWDFFGNAIVCEGTRQDADLRVGGSLAYVDHGDGTITDLNTILMWEKKSADGSIHDWAASYDWAAALDTFIPALNADGGFAGHTDWRLPNVRELESISDYQNVEPAVSTVFNTDCVPGCTVAECSCTHTPTYWTSTTYVARPAFAWRVDSLNAIVDIYEKTDRHFVRAVRGGSNVPSKSGQRFPATGQTTCWDSAGAVISCSGTGQDGEIQAGSPLAYVDNGDGTITDLNTLLIWEKKIDDGGIHDWNTRYDWAAVQTFVEELNASGGFAGHADWRLPNIREVQSITNYQESAPAVSEIFHNGCTPGCTVETCSCTDRPSYWSSTTFMPGPVFAWRVNIDTGEGSDGSLAGDGKEDRHRVRVVRGGM